MFDANFGFGLMGVFTVPLLLLYIYGAYALLILTILFFLVIRKGVSAAADINFFILSSVTVSYCALLVILIVIPTIALQNITWLCAPIVFSYMFYLSRKYKK